MKSIRFNLIYLALFAFLMAIPAANFAQVPPEQAELTKLMQDYPRPNKEGLVELLKIKEKYPNSTIMTRIDQMIAIATNAVISPSASVAEILEIQEMVIPSMKGSSLLQLYLTSGRQIISHRNVDDFDPEKVVQAVLNYAEDGKKLAQNPAFVESVPASSRGQVETILSSFDLITGIAYFHSDDAEKAFDYLELFRENGGTTTSEFYYYLGSAHEELGRKQDALDAYLEAVSGQYKDSREKARLLFMELHGDIEEFERMIDDKLSSLPFHPEPFTPTGEWKGKAVLVELFTGSECGPCQAADIAFDALLEIYEQQYLAILEYHLPIPGPDPMMNPATKLRQDYYGVNSTPSTFFDGVNKHRGGGSRQNAQMKYDQYISSINPAIYTNPQSKLQVSATLEGDVVRVAWSTDSELASANYNFALVQNEEKYAGSNGILIHKMVVRAFKSLDSDISSTSEITFPLADIEEAAEKHLKSYEKERRFKFNELHHEIDRSQLQVVFFLQDKEDKSVYNAVVCDVVVK